jgi:hypothetical protein
MRLGAALDLCPSETGPSLNTANSKREERKHIMEVVKLFSTREASALMKLSHEGLRLLCRQGKVPCRKVRNKYFMTAADINTAMSPKTT